jgi:hypothetical protein
MLCPMVARVEESLFIALKMKSSMKTRHEERAVRVAFHWRKASVPNHLLPMLYLQDYFCINWNMERPPRKTVLPQDIWICLVQLIRKPGVRYALLDRGWGLPVVGV